MKFLYIGIANISDKTHSKEQNKKRPKNHSKGFTLEVQNRKAQQVLSAKLQ